MHGGEHGLQQHMLNFGSDSNALMAGQRGKATDRSQLRSSEGGGILSGTCDEPQTRSCSGRGGDLLQAYMFEKLIDICQYLTVFLGCIVALAKGGLVRQEPTQTAAAG